VSTEEEEQQSSYENQCKYYTDLIMNNPKWSLVDIYADDGISGTSTKKRVVWRCVSRLDYGKKYCRNSLH